MIGPNDDWVRPDTADTLGPGLVHLAVAIWEDRCGPRAPLDGRGASTYMRRSANCPTCLDGLGPADDAGAL